jgi:hypothetical protein
MIHPNALRRIGA